MVNTQFTIEDVAWVWQCAADHMTAVAVSTLLYRLAAAVRSRTAANGDSIGFDVPRYFQCAFGNPSKATSRSHSWSSAWPTAGHALRGAPALERGTPQNTYPRLFLAVPRQRRAAREGRRGLKTERPIGLWQWPHLGPNSPSGHTTSAVDVRDAPHDARDGLGAGALGGSGADFS